MDRNVVVNILLSTNEHVTRTMAGKEGVSIRERGFVQQTKAKADLLYMEALYSSKGLDSLIVESLSGTPTELLRFIVIIMQSNAFIAIYYKCAIPFLAL